MELCLVRFIRSTCTKKFTCVHQNIRWHHVNLWRSKRNLTHRSWMLKFHSSYWHGQSHRRSRPFVPKHSILKMSTFTSWEAYIDIHLKPRESHVSFVPQNLDFSMKLSQPFHTNPSPAKNSLDGSELHWIWKANNNPPPKKKKKEIIAFLEG